MDSFDRSHSCQAGPSVKHNDGAGNGKQPQIVAVKTEKDAQTGYGMIGIAPEVNYMHASIFQSTRIGLERTLDLTKTIVVLLTQMVTGKIPAEVGGPVMIVQAIGDAPSKV